MAALALLSAAAPARAQKTLKQCRVDTSAAWYVKQRAWLDDSGHRWSNDTLRVALLKAVGASEGTATPVQFGWELQGSAPAVDSAMYMRLKTLAATRGSVWPTRSVVGGAGVLAVWILSQHDTGFGRAVLHRQMEAGPDESSAADVATMEDRMRLVWGRKQLYGTQFQRIGGKVEVLPTEDLAHVDLRREDAGLPPSRISACLAGAR